MSNKQLPGNLPARVQKALDANIAAANEPSRAEARREASRLRTEIALNASHDIATTLFKRAKPQSHKNFMGG